MKNQEKRISEKYNNLILFSSSHETRSDLNIIMGKMEKLLIKYDIKSVAVDKFAAKIMDSKLNLLMDYFI